MGPMISRRITVKGIVQGVGFRPFVYTQAIQHQLTGWVRNTSSGVEIEIFGPQPKMDEFIQTLKQNPPPLAQIDKIQVTDIPFSEYPSFTIQASETQDGQFIPISPDMATCQDCKSELFSPTDRRFRYPFINCTNCGPRFTIINDIPYDRPRTTMADFPMCKACREEYENPLDRRFHAQPVACEQCGPHVSLIVDGKIITESDQAILQARQMLADGKIVAVKGLGGYQIACDAQNKHALQTLRSRKHRSDKPFALMAFDLATIERYVHINENEKDLLLSPQNPIVLLKKRQGIILPNELAPQQNTYGFMLPTSPLHLLLLEPAPGIPEVLVMTSGNISDEPIAYQDAEAKIRLQKIVDATLTHNRPIHMRTDDSVVRVFNQKMYPIRRARGYAPNPIRMPDNLPIILGTGAELKNTFCLSKDNYAFISHHIGDMENYETLVSYEQAIQHYETIFRVKPELIAADLHPDYMATRYAIKRALEQNLPLLSIQHHHAHLASVMADNHLPLAHDPVLGLIFDGTGYGNDQMVWGGEFLWGNAAQVERLYHLEYMPLPGGDAGIKNPARIALAYLWQCNLEWMEDLPPVQALCADEKTMLKSMLLNNINTPSTSSMGRLFDAVSALIGIRSQVTYEGQAAIELENCLDLDEHAAYDFPLDQEEILLRPIFEQILSDYHGGLSNGRISAKFHRGLSNLCLEAARRVLQQSGTKIVGFSGGVWQNMSLLTMTTKKLTQAGFTCLIHQQVPSNDGGLALGQCSAAAAFINNRGVPCV
jgi:hydrogenase maturation protein HypF